MAAHLFSAQAARLETGTLTGWGWEWDEVFTQLPPGLTNVVAVRAGPQHGMALLGNRTVVTWGYYMPGGWVTPPELANVIAIAAGYSHDLVVKRNGRVVEWGTMNSEAMPKNLRRVSAVSAGNGFSMALRRNGTVAVWGNGDYGQTNVPAELRKVKAISAGGEHCLALRKDGTVVAWGRNDFGQTEVPVGLSNVVAIAAGPSNSLAATTDGVVWEWGVRVGPAITNLSAEVLELAAGPFHNVALKGDRTAVAWGYEWAVPRFSLTNILGISNGRASTIAISKAPVFQRVLEDRIVIAGAPVSFFAYAEGSGPISYQWLFNGEPIPGATNLDMEVRFATPTNAGLYSLRASNAFGTSTSGSALLSVTPFQVFRISQIIYAPLGGQAEFRINVAGISPTFQWLANDAPIPGATNNILTVSNVMHADAGYYRVVVANAYGSSNLNVGQLWIVPTWNIEDVSIVKTQGGPNALTFNVSIVGEGFPQWLEVGYQTVPDSAMAGVDYAPASGILRFPPLATNQTVTVECLTNSNTEPKRFFVALQMARSAPPYDGFKRSRGTGWILEDVYVPSISVPARVETEGDARRTARWPIVLSGPCARPVTLNFSTVDGTARAGIDYEPGSGQLVFPAGTVTQDVEITILGDLLRGTNRAFALDLWAPSNAVLTTPQAIFTINDDDRLVLPTGFKAEFIIGNIARPTAMAFAPDGRIFVCSQSGYIYVIKNGAVLPTPFAYIKTDTFDEAEAGLLGIALDPGFTTNQFVYVYYTSLSPIRRNRVSRLTADGDTVVPGSEQVIFDLDPIRYGFIHNGGGLHFGPDEKLYVGVGDNGISANAQSLTNLLGKILRINSDGSIPSDNPFFNTAQGANRAIWAYGLRNPFSFAFQPGTGRMFINDVGQDTWEEINEGRAGANYGWPHAEGASLNPLYDNPVVQYGHGDGCAIVGAAFYGPADPHFPAEYLGDYFFADFCRGWIRRLRSDSVVADFATGAGYIVNVHVGPDGSLYLMGAYHERLWGYVCRISYAK